MPAVIEALASLRAAGKVRWYGISTNRREVIDALRQYGPIDPLRIGYNLLERSADALLHWAKAEGPRTAAQIEENTAASESAPLAADELGHALEIARTIRTPGWIG